MDISKMTIEEIQKIQLDLELRKQILIEEELNKKKLVVQEKVDKLQSCRDVLLSLIEHSRTSCSDEKVTNGYSSSLGYASCNKCHLIEIFDGYYDRGEFDVSIDVTITKLQ